MTRTLALLLTFASGLCLAGCGDDDNAKTTGEVTGDWAQQCVATFTADTKINDVFDEYVFTAKSGQTFLLGEFRTNFEGLESVDLLYMTGAGPLDYPLELAAGASFPFTSNCTKDTSHAVLGVFKTTQVYSDEALKTKLCELPANLAVEASAQGFGYMMAGDNFMDPAAPYRIVFGNVFATECGAATEGFIRSSQVSITPNNFSSVIPIAWFSTPN